MRNYLLTAFFLYTFSFPSFTQSLTGEQKQQILRREIDSLKKVLPTMKGAKKVDWLNKQAYNYFSLWINWKLEADSSYPYAIEARNEAKTNGYKTGLAYSYLRLGTIESLKYGYDAQVNNKHDSSLLSKQEDYARQALLIGEELSDNAIIGGAYKVLGWAADHRKEFSKHVNYQE